MGFYLSGGHIETLNAGAAVLKEGGNAFDAAIAAFVASFVAEPAMSSAGGGGFGICMPAGSTPSALDFFSATPKHNPGPGLTNLAPIEVQFGDESEVYYADMGSIAIPGAIRGIFEIHRRFGTVPLKELFSAGIDLAKSGVELNNFQHLDLTLLKDIVKRSEEGRSIFFDSDLNLLPVGSTIRIPELADFLEVLAIEGEALFYQGEAGQQLVADCRDNGGVIDMDSLSSYRASWSDPLHYSSNKHNVFTMSYPSMGGPLLIYLIQKMESLSDKFEFRNIDYLNEMLNVLIEGKSMHQSPSQLYSYFGIRHPQGDNRRGSTSHFNILDSKGNAIALTMTLGEGSGYFIKDTGIHMNNMLGEPGLLEHGLYGWTPDTRMRSMMSPAIVTSNMGEPELLMGSGGSVRIPFVMAQVYGHLFHDGLDLSRAIERPRMYYDGSILQVEEALDLEWNPTVPVNKWRSQSLYFGGVHAIMKKGTIHPEYEAYGDRRRDGEFLIG